MKSRSSKFIQWIARVSFFQIIILVSSYGQSYAQLKDDTAPITYVTVALGGGTHFSARIAADFFIKEKNAVGATFLYLTRFTQDAPADFNKYNAGFFSNEARPNDNYLLFALTYSRIVYASQGEWLRFNLKGGPVLGSMNRAENYVFVPDPDPGWLFSNDKYTYQRASHSVYGFLFNPVIEVTGRKYLALSIGAYAVFTNYDQAAGLDIGIAFGRVRFRRGHYRGK